jgi:hypothetical protein
LACRQPRRSAPHPAGRVYVALNPGDDLVGLGIGCATDGAAALTAFSLAGPRLAPRCGSC